MNIQTAKKAVAQLLKPTYFASIPLEAICETLREHGYQLIQEDGTPWEGMLLGANSRTSIQLGTLAGTATRYWLALTWYRMPAPSRNIEVIGYIG